MRGLPLLYTKCNDSAAIASRDLRIGGDDRNSDRTGAEKTDAIATTVANDSAKKTAARTRTIAEAMATAFSGAHAATVCVSITAAHAAHTSSATCSSEGGRGLLDGLRQQRWRMPWVLRCVWRVLPGAAPAWARRVRFWYAGV